MCGPYVYARIHEKKNKRREEPRETSQRVNSSLLFTSV